MLSRRDFIKVGLSASIYAFMFPKDFLTLPLHPDRTEIFLNQEGTEMHVLSAVGEFFKYKLSSPFDISTAYYVKQAGGHPITPGGG